MRFATFTNPYTVKPHLIAVDSIVEVDTDNSGTYVLVRRSANDCDQVPIKGTVEEAMAALDHAKRSFTVFGWVAGRVGHEVFIGTPEAAQRAKDDGQKVTVVYDMELDDARA